MTSASETAAVPTPAQLRAADLQALVDLVASDPELAEVLSVQATVFLPGTSALDPDTVVTRLTEAGATELPPVSELDGSALYPGRVTSLPNNTLRVHVTWNESPTPSPFPRTAAG